jgi:protein Mpv17
MTKATTSCVLMSASDTLCQRYEIWCTRNLVAKTSLPESQLNLQNGCPTNVNYTGSNKKQFEQDWERTSHLAITGFTYSGPISHAWYSVLEKLVTVRHLYLNVAFKLLFDAFLFSPIAVAGYFVWRSVLEGKDLEGIRTKLQLKWRNATLASWQFWPAANVISFSLVPVQFRVLYNNILSAVWNGYLSRVNGGRLEEIVTERVSCPQTFASNKETSGVSEAEQRSQNTVCVCSKCRAVRA